MREIKFRAWDKINKKIINDVMVHFNGLPAAINNDHMAINYELMQYTGLKDKNGKKIYESDICIGLMDGGLDYTSVKFVVEYNIASFEDSYFHRPLMSEKQNLEVIGNIYENPELLEEI